MEKSLEEKKRTNLVIHIILSLMAVFIIISLSLGNGLKALFVTILIGIVLLRLAYKKK